MKRILLTLLLSGFSVLSLLAQGPLGFNYQAVIRNSAGEIVDNQQVGIQLSIISGSPTGTAVYKETFTPTTNEFGLITLTVGLGNATLGTFADIDWSLANFFLKVELDVNGGTSYIEMGTTQLLSVPFANYAFAGGSGSTAWTDKEQSVSTQKNVGIGTDTPTSKLQVISDGAYEDEAPLFEVKNSKGETVFAVYENGVKIFIEEESTSKTRGGFAVSGRTSSKEEPQEIFTVTPSLTQVYVNESTEKTRGGFAVSGRTTSKVPVDMLHITPDFTRVYVDESTGKTRGGFAVSGRTTSKEDEGEILLITPQMTQIFVDESTSKTRGGFAVSGRTSSKEIFQEMLTITPSLTQIYVDNSTLKTRGGFAVSGRTTSKEPLDIFHITPDFTRVYVDETTSKTRGGFAVSGRTTSKELGGEIFMVTPGLTEVFVEETSTAKTRGGFAVSGRTSSKADGIYDVFKVAPERTEVFIKPSPSKYFPDGFSISGLDNNYEPTELFKVSEQGTFVATTLAVAPKLTTKEAYSITQTSAISGGNVVDNGGSEIMARGIIYNLASSRLLTVENVGEIMPSAGGIIYDPNMPEGGMGDLPELKMENLTPGTLYTVRAFAMNMDGLTGYGPAVSFTTLPGSKLTFGVMDDKENPIANAVITLYPLGSPEPITNGPGNYTFSVADGEHYFSVSAPGFEEINMQPIIVEGDTHQDVYLNSAPIKITFTVKNQHGEPIEYVGIEVPEIDMAYTDINGSASLQLPAGEWNYLVTVPEVGFESHAGGTVIVEAGVPQTVNIEVTEKAKATFIVTNSASEPVSDVEVLVVIDGYNDIWQWVYEGKAIIYGLAPGTYSYSISDYSNTYKTHEGSITIVDGQNLEESVVLQILPKHTVTFTVTDESSAPVADAYISMYQVYDDHYIVTKGSKENYFSAQTDATGKVIFENVPEADYDYDVRLEEQRYAQRITVDKDMDVPVALLPPQYFTLTLDFVDAEGTPIADAYFSMYYVSGKKDGQKSDYYSGLSDQDGKLVLTDVQNGTYEYTSEIDTLATKGTITVAADMQYTVTLLPIPKYTVTFAVSDMENNPIEGATVEITMGGVKNEGNKEFSGILTTNAEGLAVFENVPQGSYYDYFYNVSKEGFYTTGNYLAVEKDITIAVKLEPDIANPTIQKP
ncbi:MAG: hypothetical protein RBT74_14075 [Tenuifilaceae bacterium]|jgi:protocatechuate 3,4-dioxygenase beta subunit/co-chaperonin GroES (HSP10)|nr:hypothetical protein [Tenuifilaceae bacterium]